jgi:ATP-dependent Clp protease ATP-binding subunit ClpC
MFERFTERARRATSLALEEAWLGGTEVGSGHLLLGMLREKDGLASEVLGQLGIEGSGVRALLPVDPVPTERIVVIRFTAAAKTVLERALYQALSLGHDFIGTEHLLLAFLHVGESRGARILGARGLSYDVVRDEIARRAVGIWRG